MSPAGSGGGQFRDGLGLRLERGNSAGFQDDPLEPYAFAVRKAHSRPLVSTCTWLLPWLLPAGLLGTVVLISLPGAFGILLAGIWGWLVFPYAAVYIRAHARVGPGRDEWNGFPDGEADYWRTKLM